MHNLKRVKSIWCSTTAPSFWLAGGQWAHLEPKKDLGGPGTREALLATSMSMAALQRHCGRCMNVNFEGEAEGLSGDQQPLPSSPGAVESCPSGDWPLLALSPG